jgi:NADPH-dependent glutamate synthase beta subunit-like oxidoreductase
VLEGVECRRATLGAPDASGRRRPQEIPGSEFVIRADTVVKAIGQRPRSEFFGAVGGLQLDRNAIVVNPATGATSVPRVFAAGDACNGGATVVEAVREGKIAARGVHDYLRSVVA